MEIVVRKGRGRWTLASGEEEEGGDKESVGKIELKHAAV